MAPSGPLFALAAAVLGPLRSHSGLAVPADDSLGQTAGGDAVQSGASERCLYFAPFAESAVPTSASILESHAAGGHYEGGSAVAAHFEAEPSQTTAPALCLAASWGVVRPPPVTAAGPT